jgi:HlyD family secretion protein
MRILERGASAVAIGMLAVGACSHAVEPDAYGNVEATEVVVGAEASGRLVSYAVTEGQTLTEGAVVGAIDATQLGLEREQLVAQYAAAWSRIHEVRQQIDALDAQRRAAIAQREAAGAQRAALVTQQEIAKRAYDRTNRLFAAQAATAQQLDQTERDYRVLVDQVKAQDEQIEAQRQQIAAQTEQIQAASAQRQTTESQAVAANAQVGQVAERIRKTQVTSPIPGTVLTSYVKGGEVVQSGQPLFKIANLAAVDVRAYVSEPQLSTIHLGQAVRVTIDAPGSQRQALPGTIEWISSQAEFTPTPIQTRDERAALVYAIKIRVPNGNGRLKIGMPVDVAFAPAGGKP